MKLVFFLQTVAPITSDQYVFLDLAAHLAEKTDHEIYYVNNYWEEDATVHENLNYLGAEDLATMDLSDAVFFAPTNYLGNLLSVAKDYPNAKICLLTYNAQAFQWLANALGDIKSEKAIFDLLRMNNACAFTNSLMVPANPRAKGEDEYDEPVIMPLALRDELVPYRPAPDLVDKDRINVALVGPIDKNLSFTFNNIVAHFKKLNLDKDITFHLIGEPKMWFSDFREATNGISRIVYTGELPMTEEGIGDYLRRNVDLIFATGIDAVECGQFGVPVVIPFSESKPYVSNDFVFLFDVEQETYKWDYNLLSSLECARYTLKRLITEIYQENHKKELAKKCYDFIKKNASLDFLSERLLECISRSSLTVKDCFELDVISARIRAFEYYFDYYHGTYNDFIKHIAEHRKVVLPGNAPNGELLAKFKKCQDDYPAKVEMIKKMSVIKVAFLVVFKTTFPMQSVFEIMLKDPKFDPYIIVCPNISRGKDYERELYADTFESLKVRYGDKVIGGYDMAGDSYLELGAEYQILFFANPYKILVHPFHDVEYFLDKPCLPIYVNYGFPAITYWDECIKLDFYNYLWKVCIENESNLQHLRNVQAISGRNAIVTGYIKMDDFAKEKVLPRERKKIFICPHHTVTGWEKLDISNFLKYSDLFLELPKMFPEVDFIFRPHPLLFTNLVQHGLWSQKKIDRYLDAIAETKNMRYDDSGYYFEEFANSDAMIHDCGSFIAEYLFTKKPCCYMMKTEAKTMQGLIPFGKECMKQYYHALSREDIINFVREVVLAGKDPLKESRERFVEEILKVNYPHSAEYLVNYIKEELE